jgi:hypothetical protein
LQYGYDPDAHDFDGFDAFQWFSYWGDRPIMETVGGDDLPQLVHALPWPSHRNH